MSKRSRFVLPTIAGIAICLVNLLAFVAGPIFVAVAGIVVIGLVGFAQFGIWMTPLIMPTLLPIFAATLLIRRLSVRKREGGES
jgi:hypothetical protein